MVKNFIFLSKKAASLAPSGTPTYLAAIICFMPMVGKSVGISILINAAEMKSNVSRTRQI
jgi:hypothetical protein